MCVTFVTDFTLSLWQLSYINSVHVWTHTKLCQWKCSKCHCFFLLSCFLTLSLFIVLFHFFFHSPSSPVFLLSAPLPHAYFMCSLPNTLLFFPTHHTSESSSSRCYHLSPLLWSSTKPLFNVLISMSQDKPEAIYCSRTHGPEFHRSLKGTLPFKLLEVSLCNFWWRSDMESLYPSDRRKAFRICKRIFSLLRNQWQSANFKLTLHNTLSVSEMSYPCSL